MSLSVDAARTFGCAAVLVRLGHDVAHGAAPAAADAQQRAALGAEVGWLGTTAQPLTNGLWVRLRRWVADCAAFGECALEMI
jgi:hypothetical protein